MTSMEARPERDYCTFYGCPKLSTYGVTFRAKWWYRISAKNHGSFKADYCTEHVLDRFLRLQSTYVLERIVELVDWKPRSNADGAEFVALSGGRP